MIAGHPVEVLPVQIEKELKLAVDLNVAFAKTGNEIENLLRGLDGRFVPPGPGNSPIRNPNVVPTGRNMYLLNPEEVPTRPSWELGVKLAKDIIDNHIKQYGQLPTKVGFDLRSSATFRDYGVMESQILYLLGVEPVWDEKQLVSDVRLIPREELGRQRIDVFIAAGGWYESNLPSRLQLWDKAIRLVTESEEPDNVIRSNSLRIAKQLEELGMDNARARILSRGRIFGIAPGREQGGMLSYQVARSGDWDSRDEIADAYLSSHKHIYTDGAWGESAEEAYDQTIQGTHTVVRSWSDHMTGPLASRYTWLHGGSLCLAVERMTGKRPDYVFSDVRDPDNSGMIRAEDALRREYRTRLFNRKWLEGMMKEGYAGADHMRFLVSNSFGWEVTRPGSVGNDNWDEMKRVLIDDKLNLGLKDWFDKNNPYAIQDAMATMLEANRKGYWQTDEKVIADLAKLYAQNISRHGLSGHITSGGNTKLHSMVRGLIQGLADDWVAQYSSQTDGSTTRESIEQSIESQVGEVASKPIETATEIAPSPSVASDNPSIAPPADSSTKPVQAAATDVAESIRGQQLTTAPLPSAPLPSAPLPSVQPIAMKSSWWIPILALFIFLGGFLFKQRL